MNGDTNYNASNLESNAAIKERIADAKGLIKNELAIYADSAKKLKVAAKAQVDAGKKYTKKQNPKTEEAFKQATAVYDEAYETASYSLARLTEYVAALDEDWQKVIFQVGVIAPKAVAKEQAEYDK